MDRPAFVGPRADGHDLGPLTGAHHPEGQHGVVLGQLDPGHPGAGAALRAHVRGVEVQQLRLVRDERQLLGAGLQFDGTDDDVVALERDDLHDRLVRVLRRHALDDARSEGLNVIPTCPAVARYIAQNPEYADLVK